jgi:dethiobiotin synthetase
MIQTYIQSIDRENEHFEILQNLLQSSEVCSNTLPYKYQKKKSSHIISPAEQAMQ